MFPHEIADRILMGAGAWLAVVCLLIWFVSALPKSERPKPDNVVPLTPEQEAFERHVAEAVHLASLPLAEAIAADQAPILIGEVEAHLREVAS